MDLTPEFGSLLSRHGAALRSDPARQPTEQFTLEATSLNKHISNLADYLRDIRARYVSAYTPTRRRTGDQYLTDRQRTEIDDSTRSLVRELDHKISALAKVEDLPVNSLQKLWNQVDYYHYSHVNCSTKIFRHFQQLQKCCL